MLEGYFTALITPMCDGKIDEEAFSKIVEWQIAEGEKGLVPCGTTGESPTLSHEEHMRVTEICIAVANGRVPIIAGTGSNSTAEAVELTRHAKSVGADAALLVMPYYNKPTQEGMYQHFKAVQDAVDIPQIIYNIPGRSVVDMTVATMGRLAQLPNVVGVKDATADLARPTLIRSIVDGEFSQLSGEDATAIGFFAQGGQGCISVTANIAPRLCAEFFEAWRNGNVAKALELHTGLMPLHEVLFCESNPIPVKYSAYLMGMCKDEMRLPLCPPSIENKQRIKEVLLSLNMLKGATV